MELTPGQKLLLAYWGPIQSAVSERVSTADLWTRVRDSAASEGVVLRGVSALDMNRLRSIAASQRESMRTFQSSRVDQAITGRMIATDISARPLQDQALAPSWIVRFEQDLVVEGELQTVWRSDTFDGSLPATVGDLRAQLEVDAEQLLLGSSGGIGPDVAVHAGIGRVQISAV